MQRKSLLKSVSWVIGFMLYTSVAAALAPSNAGILDNVLKRYSDNASVWANVMVSKASWLFWGLALISMVWTYGMMALRKADLQEFFAETVRFVAVTGFFWWILINGPAIAMSIIDSLRMIGGQAAGVSDKLAPSGIVDIGFDIFFRVLDQSSIWSPVNSVCGLFMSLVVLSILALIGTNMLLLLIAAWILSYGGIFFLGFGGARWTTDIAINYYKTVLGIGVQLMAMVLLIGIGKSFLDQYYNSMSVGISLKELAVIMVVVSILFNLTNKIPPMLAGIIDGSSISKNMGVSGGGLLAAAGVAAAAAGTAGAATAAGLTHIAGGASALKAAFQVAQQNLANGTGKFAGGQATDSGGLAAAMGTAGKFAADMASNFSKGLGEVSKAKASSTADSIKDNIGQTLGGKIAAAIHENAPANQAQKQEGQEKQEKSSASEKAASHSQASFSGNGLGAGKQGKQGKHQEVVDFVNKGRK